MGFQGEYIRRGEDTSPVLYDKSIEDGYNYIRIDIEEIDGGAFFGLNSAMGVIFVEAQFLAVDTAGDNTAAGCMIRRATYKFDGYVPALYVARFEHDRFTTPSGGPSTSPVVPYDQVVGPGSLDTGPYPELGDDGYATTSISTTVPDIAWPLRNCVFAVDTGTSLSDSVIKLQWAIYDKVGVQNYHVAWEVKLKMYRPG